MSRDVTYFWRSSALSNTVRRPVIAASFIRRASVVGTAIRIFEQAPIGSAFNFHYEIVEVFCVNAPAEDQR